MKSYRKIFHHIQSITERFSGKVAKSSPQTKIVSFAFLAGIAYAMSVIYQSQKTKVYKDNYALQQAQQYQEGSSNVNPDPVFNVKDDVVTNDETQLSKGNKESLVKKDDPLDLLEPENRKLAGKILKGDKIISDREASICKCQVEYDNADSCAAAALIKPEDLALKSAVALEKTYADIIGKDEVTQKALGACNERKNIIDEIVSISDSVENINKKMDACRNTKSPGRTYTKKAVKNYILADLKTTKAILKNQSKILTQQMESMTEYCEAVAQSQISNTGRLPAEASQHKTAN